MPFFWRKQASVESMLNSYLERSDACFQQFEKAFDTYMKNGQSEAFESAVQKTHEAESAADDMRREIELTLYGKALLPESRGDLLGLLESFDRIPNMAETVLFVLRCQRTQIPEFLIQDYKRLIDLNLQAYYLLRKAIDDLTQNPKVALHSSKQVDEKESECDRFERKMVCKIFESDLDTATKLLLKEVVILIGNISDRAEAVADRISIVAIKRQI